MKIHKYDNTFIIEKNGMPYQVIDGMEEYQRLIKEYKENPKEFEEEYPYIPSLEEVKSVKKQEINQAREQARLNEGAEFDNDLFDIDDKAQANILAKVTTASLSSDDSMFTYRSKTNITHTFTKAEIIALGLAIGDKIDKVYEKSWLLKKKIDEATTKEEIAEISWNTVIENT